MEFSSWITYAVATFILSLTPGPGVFSCLSSGMRHGFRKGVWNGVGMQFANVFIVILVSLGLGAILMASGSLFATVKWVGVAYLLYLGIATWRAPVRAFEADQDEAPASAREIFMRGFWVNATNPKGIIFFAAILPQFTDSSAGHVPVQMLLLGLEFVLIALVLDGIWAVLAGTARERLASSPRTLEAIGGAGGVVLVGLGVGLAVTGRK